MALTTLAKVKRYLGIKPDQLADDELITDLIASCSAEFEADTDRVFAADDYTEVRSGYGTTSIYPIQWPVNSVTSVTVDGDVIPSRPSVGESGWVLNGNRIDLVGYTFTRGVSNIELAYNAGYATIPSDIEQAIIGKVALAYTDKGHIGQGQKSVNGEVVTYNGGADLVRYSATADKYRRVVAG